MVPNLVQLQAYQIDALSACWDDSGLVPFQIFKNWDVFDDIQIACLCLHV